MKTIAIDKYRVGLETPLLIIAGPCALESDDICLRIGEQMRDRCAELGFQYVFKASFDKANRSSISSARGPGLQAGVDRLAHLRDKLGVPVTTDIHEAGHAGPAAAAGIDILQIPAFLCRQTDLLVAAAETGKTVNVKKGQFLSPDEMSSVVGKLEAGGASNIMLTERGTFFGYQRLVNDFIGVADMMDLGYPVCFDVTHSTQLPGAGSGGQQTGDKRITAGRADRAPMLARCAIATGVQALFLETHPNPKEATSDAATMLPLETTLKLLGDLARLRAAV